MTLLDYCKRETQRLADLSGLRLDSLTTTEMASTLLSISANTDIHSIWCMRGLCIASLITYARIFGQGVRVKIKDEFFAILSVSEQQHHQEFLDLRDKWAAHSVNDYETSFVQVEISEGPTGEPVVSRVTDGTEMISILSPQQMAHLLALSKKATDYLGSLIEAERIAVASAIPQSDLIELARDNYAFSRPTKRKSQSERRSPFRS